MVGLRPGVAVDRDPAFRLAGINLAPLQIRCDFRVAASLPARAWSRPLAGSQAPSILFSPEIRMYRCGKIGTTSLPGLES